MCWTSSLRHHHDEGLSKRLLGPDELFSSIDAPDGQDLNAPFGKEKSPAVAGGAKRLLLRKLLMKEAPAEAGFQLSPSDL